MPEFRRPQHRIVAQVLATMDADFLEKADCFFAGGTQVALSLGEFRESRDIDFLCASRRGFKRLRETVHESSLGRLLKKPLPLAREVRADRDGIRTFLSVGEGLLKFEIVREGRIDLQGQRDAILGVPVLTTECAVAEKLLANTDRGLDDSTHCRDAIDLAFLIMRWGEAMIEAGLVLAEPAYGSAVMRYLERVMARFKSEPGRTKRCAEALGIDDMVTLRQGLSRLERFVAHQSRG